MHLPLQSHLPLISESDEESIVESVAVPLRRSFLKWAGNKFQILPDILRALPAGNRLVEPFAGSGVVFLNARFKASVVADTNRALVDTFLSIQRDADLFIKKGRSLFTPEFNSPEAFYALREEFNSTQDEFRKGLLFVYLNRHCFNGLCRFNQSGKFNVPFGKYRAPNFPEKEVRTFAEAAQSAQFVCQDFATTMRSCSEGDVVYCDPPYVPLSKTASFTSYSTNDFQIAQQEQLVLEAKALAARGIPVIISNHDTDTTRALYADATSISSLEVQRFISCDGSNRGKAREIIASFLP